jgi:CRP-like cAMP-binding protein
VYQTGPENSARLLEILGPGDWFGVPALAGADVYGSRAVAVSAVTVSAVPADKWLALLAQQPGVAAQWVTRLAGKLVQAREDAACLVFDDCNQRLIKTLLAFSRSAAATAHPEGVVLRITHQQLAQAVGAARETVSLALTQLRQQNLLRTGRNQLFFNPEVLENFSRGNGVAELSGERVA